jgi:hypothetical protein
MPGAVDSRICLDWDHDTAAEGWLSLRRSRLRKPEIAGQSPFASSQGALCKTVGLAYVGANPTLPLPAETARELGIPRLAGLLCLVPLCFMMCRCEPLCSSGYGHMADGIGAEPAVHRTAGSGVFDGPPSSVKCPSGFRRITGRARIQPAHGPRDPRAAARACGCLGIALD